MWRRPAPVVASSSKGSTHSSAGDFNDALMAERQASANGRWSQADTLDLARGFRQQFRLVGAVEPEHAGDRTGRPAQMRADRDVLQHGHVGHQLDVLEGAGDAEFYNFLRRRIVDLVAEHRDGAAGRRQHSGSVKFGSCRAVGR